MIYILKLIKKYQSVSSGLETASYTSVVSMSKKNYPYCLVLVGSRIKYRDSSFKVKLKSIEGIMVDSHSSQISSPVKKC